MPDPFIDLSVVAGYFVLLVALGWTLRRFNSDISDYFRSGGRATWWLVGSSAFMAGFSAWTFTGAAGVAYEAGWSVMIIFLANAAGFFVNFLFLAPWFRQLRAITAPEVIRMRFGMSTQQFYAWVSVIIGLLYAGLHLYGLAIFSAAVFGFNIEATIVVVGIAVLLYSTLGGLWAVMSTDFLQGLILVPLTVLVAVLCLVHVGGVEAFFTRVTSEGLEADFAVINDAGRFSGNAYTWLWAVAMFVNGIWTYNTLTAAPRYFAVKDGRAARQAALLGAVLMLLGAAVWFIPPMTARLVFASEVDAVDISKPAEAAYAIVSMRLLPAGLTGLMMVAIFSATMSSMDTGLNRNAAIFTRDIYPTICRWLGVRQLRHRALLRLGQGFSLLMGGVIILLALYFARDGERGIFEIMLNIGAMLGQPMATPMLLALFIRRVPWWSAICSVLFGLVPSLMSVLSSDPWSFQMKILTIIPAGVVGFCITMPFWGWARSGYRRRVARFFTRMHTPVDFAREVGAANDFRQLSVIGRFAIVIGAAVLACLFAADDWRDIASIVVVGIFIGGIGGLFIWYGGRAARETT